MMEKFDFLLGNWNLEYRIPKSGYSKAGTGTGLGTFKRILNDKFVVFDYSTTVSIGDKSPEKGKAHAIFAWDDNMKIYRFWWFESSGSLMKATCRFIDKDILFLNWHDSVLIQSFSRIGPDKVILKMEQPVSEKKYELILEVIFTRK